jgi:hypothetical protein
MITNKDIPEDTIDERIDMQALADINKRSDTATSPDSHKIVCIAQFLSLLSFSRSQNSQNFEDWMFKESIETAEESISFFQGGLAIGGKTILG